MAGARKGPSTDAPTAPDATTAASVDAAEVAKFEAIAEDWWNEAGPFRPLHRMNPARIGVIRDALARHFARDVTETGSLAGLSLLDIGCGGGIAAEPLARLGAKVIGVDASAENIRIAAEHAGAMGLEIDYRAVAAEDLAAQGAAFDAVLALEVVEHVTVPADFIALAGSLVRPGGLLIVSTINRTLKALALAKFAAEYVLRWAPKGAHDYRKFVRPQELRTAFDAAGLVPAPPMGLSYDPLKDDWHQSLDTDINYVMWGTKGSRS